MPILSLAILLSAALTIAAAYLGPARRWLFLIFKPITTVLIIVVALLPGTAFTDRYAGSICLGLLLSLIGDILLMLRGDHFRQGLASFLLARLCYIVAFVPGLAADSFPVALLLFSIVAVPALRYLWPALPGGLKAAVSGYVAVTVLMTALPGALALENGNGAALSAAIGALLFLVSDLVLAIDRFRRPFGVAHGIILATYYGGQLLIALSVGERAIPA